MSFAGVEWAKQKMCASSGSYYVLRLGRIVELFDIRRIESQKKKKNIFKPKYSLGCSESSPKNYHMETVIHGHICSHSTHTNTHTQTNTQTWGNCPGDGICRQLQTRSVSFPLTFSKTCKKCPFHYWLNNVIWAPTGPNRSRQRQSSTHMLRINQITGVEGLGGWMRERRKERDTARHLEDWQYSLFLLPPPLLFSFPSLS